MTVHPKIIFAQETEVQSRIQTIMVGKCLKYTMKISLHQILAKHQKILLYLLYAYGASQRHPGHTMMIHTKF